VFGRKKMEWSCFCGSGAAWSSPKHALTALERVAAPSLPRVRGIYLSFRIPPTTSRFTTVKMIHIFIASFHCTNVCHENESQFPINTKFVQYACRNTPEHNLTKYDIQQSAQILWMPHIDKHMLHDPIDLQKMQIKKQNQNFSRWLTAVWIKDGDKPCFMPS
jgi:hypothetical protein